MILLLVLSLIVLKKLSKVVLGPCSPLSELGKLEIFWNPHNHNTLYLLSLKYDVRGFVIPDKIHTNIIDT